MECNRKCYWQYNGECCPESEEGYNDAKPNDENCPTFLIHDFDKQFWITYYNIIDLINERHFSELKQIEEFIINQREPKS
jgi:hypothetical protein